MGRGAALAASGPALMQRQLVFDAPHERSFMRGYAAEVSDPPRSARFAHMPVTTPSTCPTFRGCHGSRSRNWQAGGAAVAATDWDREGALTRVPLSHLVLALTKVDARSAAARSIADAVTVAHTVAVTVANAVAVKPSCVPLWTAAVSVSSTSDTEDTTPMPRACIAMPSAAAASAANFSPTSSAFRVNAAR